MRFLLKVNIPVESGQRRREGRKARRDHPTHSLRAYSRRPSILPTTTASAPGSFFWRCKTLLKSPPLPNHGSLRSMQRLKFIRS